MKNKLFSIIAALILSLFVSFVNAQNQPYAELSSDGTILTFKYGEKPSGDNIFDLNVEDLVELGGWHEDGIRENITTVVFHQSFAAARPTSCYKWFYEMINLNTISGMNENLNTSDVTDMESMFEGCSSLTTLDLSNFNTANVMIMHNMFRNCSNLTTIFVGSSWSTDYAVSTGGINMFEGCYSLVGGAGTAVNDLLSYYDIEYARIDGGPTSVTPGYFTGVAPYVELSSDGKTLTFKYGEKPTTGTVYDLNTGDNTPEWYNNNTNVTKVVFDESFKSARPTSCARWFWDFTNLETIEHLEYLNTSSVTTMKIMFYYCTKLSTLDVSHFNTANVEDMGEMFGHCKVTELDVSNFNTAKVKETYAMFYDCSNLTDIDVSNFNTASVTKMREMFYGCSGLTTLDLSSFNTTQVADMNAMFYDCNNLTTIKVSNEWTTSNVSDGANMFYGCSALVGGNGTTYDANHVDKTYAIIDGKNGNPGYLTIEGTPFVVLSDDGTILTFKYGEKPDGAYELNKGTVSPAWEGKGSTIKQVVFDES
nr:BspA family leucine-rich repeat surface protein [Bacteroidales bacterium]